MTNHLLNRIWAFWNYWLISRVPINCFLFHFSHLSSDTLRFVSGYSILGKDFRSEVFLFCFFKTRFALILSHKRIKIPGRLIHTRYCPIIRTNFNPMLIKTSLLLSNWLKLPSFEKPVINSHMIKAIRWKRILFPCFYSFLAQRLAHIFFFYRLYLYLTLSF